MWRPCVHEGERESAAVILGGMSADRAKMSFSSVVSLGVGTMIGAGIFALLGQAGTMAGSAVWVSFLIGGFIALLTGYSLGKLGARYPSAGGIAEYLIHGYGNGLFAAATVRSACAPGASGHNSAAVSAVSPTKCRDSRNNSSSTRVARSARTIAFFTAGKSRLSISAAIYNIFSIQQHVISRHTANVWHAVGDEHE